MPAGRTYEPLASVTLSASTASVLVMNSIPSTYTDLVLVVYGQDTRTGGNDCYIQFNSDTGNNYSETFMRGDGSTTTSSRSTSRNVINIGANAGSNQSYYTVMTAHIMNYSNTSVKKTVLSRSGGASVNTMATVGLWSNTNAITRIDLNPGSGYSFTSGCTFTLYGVRAA